MTVNDTVGIVLISLLGFAALATLVAFYTIFVIKMWHKEKYKYLDELKQVAKEAEKNEVDSVENLFRHPIARTN